MGQVGRLSGSVAEGRRESTAATSVGCRRLPTVAHDRRRSSLVADGRPQLPAVSVRSEARHGQDMPWFLWSDQVVPAYAKLGNSNPMSMSIRSEYNYLR